MHTQSYAHGPGLTPLLGQTIGDNLRTTVERFPDHDALVVCHQGFRATYKGLWDLTTRAAQALLGLGVPVGERVGIWATNCFEWVVLQYATARVGAILVNINPAYQAPELEYTLRQSGVSVLFHGTGFRQTVYSALLEGVAPRCADLRHVIAFGDGLERFLSRAGDVTEAELGQREAALEFDDPINIQYTSGTTGHPKGATLTHQNILNNGYFTGEGL